MKDDIIEKIESGELDDVIRQLAEDRAVEDQEILDFIHSDVFKVDFEYLKEYLVEHGSFLTDGVYYTETPEEQNFSNKALAIFDTVYKNSDNIEDDEEAAFPTSIVEYQGVKMSVTYGQGSFMKFWLS